MPILPASVERLIELAIEEDVGGGDITTEITVPAEAMGSAVVIAKQELVLAGSLPAEETYRRIDPRVLTRFHLRDGDRAQPGTILALIEGPLRSLLTGERIFLNFLGQLSGVATAAWKCAREVEDTGCRILDTRKTVPGMRWLQKEAVRAGGGVNHRIGLYDAVLIKDNHITAAGGLARAVRAAKQRVGASMTVEVEAESLDEVAQALEAGADIIMLDNMDNDTMRRAVVLVGGRARTEASGNMTLERLRGVAAAGVDYISIGALTHSAPCADISMRVQGR
ncbi:MAG: putative nicotinate-nucleotide pyrophosphorylase [carboxylating] [Myxococcota bacterium]|nr:putative nicotinate-nucleotide pyrophosphorylase [carboxylating] [Myxococcota bacterium]